MTDFPSWQSVLPVLLALAAAPLACHAIFFNDPILIPSLECFLKFALFNFDPTNFDQYDSYFRNESITELAQTGKFLGPDSIKEYARFGDESSQYIAAGPIDEQRDISYQGYEDGKCVFLVITHAQYSADPTYTGSNVTFRMENMFKIFYDFRDNYISRINVFFSEALFDTVFNGLLNADTTRQFICDTMIGTSCADIIATPDNCIDTLQELPATEADLHVDGNSQGCRALHAVFASVNDVHCPHISLAPQQDVNGKIKCQTIADIQAEDLFTADEITKFFDIGLAAGIDPTTGIKIVDSAPAGPPPCGLFGLSILCFNACGFFGRLLDLCATV